MDYLFISGAPRSGTSALTELLSSHKDISIGMERFKFLYSKKQVNKSLFDFDKFFDFKTEETNIDDKNGKYIDYYKKIKEKFEESKIVGDKYPQLYKFWPNLFQEFGEYGKYIFIIRDIEEVASSFNVRANNPKDKWPKENDYRKAVEIWNNSLITANNAVRDGYPILITSYKKLFDNEAHEISDELDRIIKYLNIEKCEHITSKQKSMSERYVSSIKHKEQLILDGQVDFINNNARMDLMNTLLDKK